MRYIIILLVFISVSSHADLAAFECRVESSYIATNQGVLADQPHYKHLLGGQFRVDKNTGELTGVFKTDGIKTQPSIIDYGSSQQAFKVLIPYYPETTVDFLLINSYVSHRQKPFTFLTLGAIFTGLCID